jgi:hypothetical protein
MDTDRPQPIHGPRIQGDPRARRISKIVVPVAAVGLVLFSLMNVWITLSREGLPDEIEGLMLYPDVSYEVVSGPIEYDVEPPYGGPNAGVVQDCGRYRVPVQNENTVASLAVGAVWLAYDPTLPEDEIDNVHAFAAGELYAISAPYPGLRAPIVLTAWGAQVEVESSLDPRIAAFIRDFAESKDVPNPNRPCSGGVNIPPP